LAKILAQAEPLDAHSKRRATAAQHMFEQGFQPQRTLDIPLHFPELALSQLSPARADRPSVKPMALAKEMSRTR
jgi:hypothetical protein